MPQKKTNLQNILDASGFTQYTDKEVVKNAPQPLYKNEKIELFSVGTWINDTDLEKEYTSRGLVPASPYTLGEQINDLIKEKEYIGTHWQDADGKWCFATFDRWNDERSVDVGRRGSVWDDYWWFAGVRLAAVSCHSPTTTEDWRKRFRRLWGNIDFGGGFVSEKLEDFIASEKELSRLEERKEIKDKLGLLIADEINIARTDGFPTSRLTSLAVKFTNYLNNK